MFDYYCRGFGFDCLELNSSFYHLPAARSMASLARRSPEGFSFMVKLYQAFTHNLAQASPEMFLHFWEGIAPLAESGKLEGVLAQFPPGFLPSSDTREWLGYLRAWFAPIPLFVEFRHRAWGTAENLAFLQQAGLGYCMVDMPRVSSLPSFLPWVTNGVGYVRLHGRNRLWYRPLSSRYEYHYHDGELRGLLASLEGITPRPSEVFIFFNNCHAGAAVRSAKRFRELAAAHATPALPGIH